MNEETNNWTWNDGWILMSIFMAQKKGHAALSDILAAADGTDHAIPTSNELSDAFSKLVNAGIVLIEDSKYRISNKYAAGIKNMYNSKGGLFETPNKGLKWLERSGLSPINEPKITVTAKELKLAYDEYISRIKRKG